MADRIDIQALREAASKATKGPWKQGRSDDHFKREVRDSTGNGIAWFGSMRAKQAHADASHTANCGPETILALCDVVEAAQKLESAFSGYYRDHHEFMELRTALQPFKKD